MTSKNCSLASGPARSTSPASHHTDGMRDSTSPPKRRAHLREMLDRLSVNGDRTRRGSPGGPQPARPVRAVRSTKEGEP